MLLNNHPLADLIPLIDWSYFFSAWELNGRYPELLDHPEKGAQARELFGEAQQMLQEIVDRQLLQANAIAAIYPANGEGDDIVLYTDDSRREELMRLPQLRNQEAQEGETPNLCLADFVAPADSPEALRKDYIATFALTTGIGLQELISRYRQAGDDYSAIMANTLADRLAEAFAVYIHNEMAELIGKDEQCHGIRAAYGYPACPDHSGKRALFDLMQVEANTGIRLTGSYMMTPESSICGLIITNPAARYFSVGLIDEEQLQDYALRKHMPVDELRKLLANNLR